MISASACSLKACTRAAVSPNKLFTVLLLPTLDLPACLGAWSDKQRRQSHLGVLADYKVLLCVVLCT
jgi:hypothetical protein